MKAKRSPTATTAIAPGAQIGHFQIRQLLGEGGVGRVYAALDEDLGRMVALKALRPEVSREVGFVDRFRAEAANLARLSHPNIATLYSLFRDGQDTYMVMELVGGYTLEEVLRREGRLHTEAMQAIAAQVTSGLDYAHRMGVIHRDIKPANLMLTESGQLKIMDFGIARVRGSQRLTRAGNIIGTLAYMPPEQIKGADNDERSDIYSLGCVIYELLCGIAPFQSDTEYDLIQAQIAQPPPPLTGRCTDLRPEVEAALQRALAKSPSERFGNAKDFGRALGAFSLARDPTDIAREQLLAQLPPVADPTVIPKPLHSQIPTQESRKAAAPTVAVPAPRPVQGGRGSETSDAEKQSKPKLPLLVLTATAVVVSLGAGGLLVSHLRSGAAQQSEVTRPLAEASPAVTDVGNRPQAQTVPNSTTILPAPDAQTQLAKRSAAEKPPACPPVEGDAGVVRGHVDGVADDGSPQLGSAKLTLFGLKTLDDSAHSRLSMWLSGKGSDVVCCAMPQRTYRCLTAGSGKKDLAAYLLLNGLAHAADDAPRTYFDAESDARTNRRGLWK